MSGAGRSVRAELRQQLRAGAARRSAAAQRASRRCAAPATRASIRHRCGSPTLLAWSDSVGRMLGASPPRSSTGAGRRGARRQSGASRHAAVRGALRRTPVRSLGGAARRWPRDHPRRSRGPGRGAPRPAAQGGRKDAVFAHGRRPRGAALLGARVHVQRGHASPRRADHAGAEPRGHRGIGGARHVLRRPSESRAGRHRLPRRAVVRALRQFRDSRRPSGAGCAQAAGRLRDRDALPGARRAVAGGVRPLVRGDLPAHRRDDRRMDAGGLRPRRDEHRQHVDPGADHRLWSVRLARGLRSGVDAQHHRCGGAALPVRQSTGRSRNGTWCGWPTRCSR